MLTLMFPIFLPIFTFNCAAQGHFLGVEFGFNSGLNY